MTGLPPSAMSVISEMLASTHVGIDGAADDYAIAASAASVSGATAAPTPTDGKTGVGHATAATLWTDGKMVAKSSVKVKTTSPFSDAAAPGAASDTQMPAAATAGALSVEKGVRAAGWAAMAFTSTTASAAAAADDVAVNMQQAEDLLAAGDRALNAGDFSGSRALYTKIPLYVDHLDPKPVQDLQMYVDAAARGIKKLSAAQLERVRDLRYLAYLGASVALAKLVIANIKASKSWGTDAPASPESIAADWRRVLQLLDRAIAAQTQAGRPESASREAHVGRVSALVGLGDLDGATAALSVAEKYADGNELVTGREGLARLRKALLRKPLHQS